MAKMWPQDEAKKIIKRYGKEKEILFETGYGPSGLPHIGTFGEVVRTYFIVKALEQEGVKSKIISFSDDMDGLRKVPLNMDKEFLEPHLGKPLSSIPDPFGCHNSYAEHNNEKLKEMLDHLGIEYHFHSSTEQYKKGVFNEAIALLLRNLDKLKEIILPTLSEENRKGWFPYFQICENCGKLYTSKIISFDPEKLEVEYECSKEFNNIKGCGYKGKSSVLDGHGKFTWRVDWAMRWIAFGIDYELYGKDLIDSANVSKAIVRALGKKPPLGMFYELFLNEDGSKISKSVGDGVTLEEWLKYGNEDSLKLFMFKKPSKAKRLYYQIIPQYMDEFLTIQNQFFAGKAKDETYQFLTFFSPPAQNPYPTEVMYSTICNLILAVGTDDKDVIKKYLFTEKVELNPSQEEYINEIIEKAMNYARDIMSKDNDSIEFNEEFRTLIQEFIEFLKEGGHSSEEIHNKIYELAKNNDKSPKDFFAQLYLAISRQPRGPRLGNFISMLGEDYIAQKLEKFLEERK